MTTARTVHLVLRRRTSGDRYLANLDGGFTTDRSLAVEVPANEYDYARTLAGLYGATVATVQS